MESSAKDAARHKYRASQRNKRGRGGRLTAARGNATAQTLNSNAGRYSDEEGESVPTAAEPAERTQRSKGADLAELLRETYADDAFTTTRYRQVEEPLPELPPEDWSASTTQALDLDVEALVACLQSIPTHLVVDLPEEYGASFQAKALASTAGKGVVHSVRPAPSEQGPNRSQHDKPAKQPKQLPAATPSTSTPSWANRAAIETQPASAAASASAGAPTPQTSKSATSSAPQTQSSSGGSTAGHASPSARMPAAAQVSPHPHEGTHNQPADVQSAEDVELDALLSLPTALPRPSIKQKQGSRPPSSQMDDSFEAFLQTL